jgi:hypothetical protein
LRWLLLVAPVISLYDKNVNENADEQQQEEKYYQPGER